MKNLKPNHKIIFDFDSTIIGLESLDELAKLFLKNHPQKEILTAKIEQITNQGMQGDLDFQESLKRRMELIKPSLEDIHKAIKKLQTTVSKSFLENQKWIKSNQNNLFVISGGFEEILKPICIKLGFKEESIFGNQFIFDENGEKVIDYKKDLNLAQNQGKIKQLKDLKTQGLMKSENSDKVKIIGVGDGSTDFELKESGEADLFIYYKEHVNRGKISSKADKSVSSLNEIIDFLESF